MIHRDRAGDPDGSLSPLLGLSREQIAEAIIHLAYDIGWPAANNAMQAARQAFAEADAENG